MKNILFLTHSHQKGGAEQSMIHLINNIDTNKFKIHLICPHNTVYVKEISSEIDIIELDLPSVKRSPIKYFNSIRSLNRILDRYKIDIIHANGWRAPWFVVPFKFKRIKKIWHHRDRFNSNLYNFVLPLFFDNIICISNYVASTLKCRDSKIKIIYNGINSKNPNNSLNITKKIDSEIFRVGIFGRIVEWKRFDIVIQAIERAFREEKPEKWKFLIVGGTEIDGSTKYLEYLKDKAQKLGILDNIIFTGHVEDPLSFMEHCDLTINFSDREPFGRVIIESMIMGTPVVVANSGGAPEIIRTIFEEDLIKYLIAEDNNEQHLADLIYEFYKLSEDKKELISRLGKIKTEELFNMKNISREVEAVYQKLI